MKEIILATRYVKALRQALSESEVESTFNVLADLISFLLSNKQLLAVLNDPGVGRSKKETLIFDFFHKKMSNPKVENFFRLLIKKNRFGLLSDLQEQIRVELANFKNEQDVIIESCSEFNSTNKKELLDYLEKITKKNIQPSFQINPDLVGGFRAKVNQTVYDGSVESGLEGLVAAFN